MVLNNIITIYFRINKDYTLINPDMGFCNLYIEMELRDSILNNILI